MRRGDNLVMQSGMDFFYKTFSNDIGPLKFVRNAALKLAENSGPIKKLKFWSMLWAFNWVLQTLYKRRRANALLFCILDDVHRCCVTQTGASSSNE